MDNRKASYASCLNLWRRKDAWNGAPERKPSYQMFGLTEAQAIAVETLGHSLEGQPKHMVCLRMFDDKPDPGDPTCVCSYCNRLIPAGATAIRATDPATKQEWRCHEECWRKLS